MAIPGTQSKMVGSAEKLRTAAMFFSVDAKEEEVVVDKMEEWMSLTVLEVMVWAAFASF